MDSTGYLLDLIRGLSPMQEATDPRDLFAALARAVVRAVRGDACVVSIVDPVRQVVRDAAAAVEDAYLPKSLAEEYPLSEYPVTKYVLETGKGLEVAVNDPDADPAQRRFLQDLGFARALVTRFAVDGDAIGTIQTYRTANRPFRADDPSQIDILSAFAANSYSKIQLSAKLEEHYTKTMEALCSALEARDPHTQAHTGRIRDLSIVLADALQVSSEVRSAVKLGSILHDVGKIGISDSILRKPGPLTDGEWDAMRLHPQIGHDMLRGIEFLEPALPVVLHHHERFDGRGYPWGLTGDAIPMAARIVAVCDAFDAMTCDRIYRSAMPIEQACDEILACAGAQFDPRAAAVLVDVVDRTGTGDAATDMFVRYAI